MTEKKSGKKGYILLIAVVLVIIAGLVVYKLKKDAFLDHQLKDMVSDKTHELYKISYDSIQVDEVGGNVYIRNLYMQGDTARQLEMLRNGDTDAAKIIINVLVPELKVVGFKTAKALLSKQLVCNQVIISNPKVTVYLFPGQISRKNEKEQQQQFYKQILGNLKLIKADSLLVINSEVVATDFYSKETKFHTYNTSVNLTDLAIDSSYNEDTTRTLFCKEIKVTTAKVILGDKKNIARATGLSFDTRSAAVSLARFEYDAFKNNGFFKGDLKGIVLKGMNVSGPVENTDISIDDIVLDKGTIETLATFDMPKIKRPESKPVLTGWVRSFTLKSLQLKSMLYISRGEKGTSKVTIKNNVLQIKNLAFDRTAILNASLISKAKEVNLSNDDISLTSADNKYIYRFTGIKINTISKRLSATSVKIIPKLNEPDFAARAHYQTDRYNIAINNIDCRNVDMEALVKGEINIGSINSSGSSIYIFHDLSYPIDSVAKWARHNTYPHQLLHTLNFPLNVDKFTATNSTIEYKEKNPKSKSSGKVRFTNATITISNISNKTPKPGEKISLRFAGSFLSKIPVTASIDFYNDQWRKGRFSVEAIVHKSFDATVLNQLTEPMSLASIDKGTVQSFRFSIVADTSISQGTLSLAYQDMKISLLKKKGAGYDKKGIVSFLANILVKNSNTQNTDMRIGKINIMPNRYKSFFNFIWKSIFAGAKQVLLLKL